MRRILSLLVLSCSVGEVALAQEATSSTYALSPSKSAVYVVIRNDPEASLARLGHDHVIFARDFKGTVTWPTAPGTGPCSVDISVPALSLVVDPPGYRVKAGLDPNATIDDGDKGKLSKNMWGESQLDTSRYAAITFESTSCPGGTGKVKVDGTMTVRGTAKPVSVTLDVSADGSTFSASGRLETTHGAFGFKPFAASPFGPRNQERLQFVIQVTGSKG